jgi:hypothetical protein
MLSLVFPQLKKLRPAALALKVKLEEIETQTDANSLDSTFQTAKKKQLNAIMRSRRSTPSRRTVTLPPPFFEVVSAFSYRESLFIKSIC